MSAQVVKASDVLFLFADSVQELKQSMTSNRQNLKKDQILVAVCREGSLEEYQVTIRLQHHFVCV